MSQVAGQLKAYAKFPLHDGHRIQNNKPGTAAIAATKPSRPIKINALLFVPSVMPVAKTTKASNVNEKRRLRLSVNFCLIVSILFIRTRQMHPARKRSGAFAWLAAFSDYQYLIVLHVLTPAAIESGLFVAVYLMAISHS